MKRYSLLLFACLLANHVLTAQTWLTQATGFTTASRGIQNVSIVNPNVVWASAYDGSGGSAVVQEFTRTLNGGTTWTPGVYNAPGISGYSTSNLFALNKDTAWVAMYNGTSGGGKIIRTNNGGSTWAVQSTATFAAPAGFGNFVHFFNANEGVCMGDPNGGFFEIYTTTNGGTNWTRVVTGNIPAPLSASEYGLVNIYTANGNTIWFGTTQGRIFKSTNKGATWTVSSTPYASNIYVQGIAFRDAMNGLAIGVNGTSSANAGIIKTTDGGATWTMLTTAFTGGLDAKSTISYVPGTRATYVIGSVYQAGPGSAYTCDDGANWAYIDNVQHLNTVFLNSNTGFSGGFNTDNVTGGMFKWDGAVAPTVLSQDTVICSGNAVNLMASGTGTMNWYTVGSSGTPVGTGTTLNVTPTATTTYFAELTNGGKTSFRNYVTVTVNPTPSATVSGVLTSMVGNTDTYTVPTTTGATYLWSAVNGSVVSGQGTSSANIQWTSAGTGVVTVTVTLGTCSKTTNTNVTVSMVSSIQTNNPLEVGLMLYPNPAQEQVNIQLNSAIKQYVSVQLMNVSGQLVQNIYQGDLLGTQTFTSSVTELPAGIYFCQIRTNKGVNTSRIVIE